jgi:hypothetical protein
MGAVRLAVRKQGHYRGYMDSLGYYLVWQVKRDAGWKEDNGLRLECGTTSIIEDVCADDVLFPFAGPCGTRGGLLLLVHRRRGEARENGTISGQALTTLYRGHIGENKLRELLHLNHCRELNEGLFAPFNVEKFC